MCVCGRVNERYKKPAIRREWENARKQVCCWVEQSQRVLSVRLEVVESVISLLLLNFAHTHIHSSYMHLLGFLFSNALTSKELKILSQVIGEASITSLCLFMHACDQHVVDRVDIVFYKAICCGPVLMLASSFVAFKAFLTCHNAKYRLEWRLWNEILHLWVYIRCVRLSFWYVHCMHILLS